MKRLLVVAVLLTAVAAFASDSPPGMACEDATLVRYHRGPNVAAFATSRGGHLEHLRKGLSKGTILFAGPITAGEELVGGLAIFKGQDLKAIAAMTETDPVIANKAFTYTLDTWMMCRSAPEAPKK